MVAITTALLAGSSLLSAYGNYQQGQAQKESLLDSAYNAELQKREVARRNERNIELMRGRTEDLIDQQQLAFAASNVAVTSGASFQAQTHALNTFIEQALNIDMETNYSNLVKGQEASSMVKAAGQAETAGMLGAVGSLADGAYSYSKNKG